MPTEQLFERWDQDINFPEIRDKDDPMYKHTLKSKSYGANDRIQCKYRGRSVVGVIKSIDEKSIVVKLETDYRGKNEDWYAGDLKVLQKRLTKKLIKK